MKAKVAITTAFTIALAVAALSVFPLPPLPNSAPVPPPWDSKSQKNHKITKVMYAAIFRTTWTHSK